MLEQLNRYFTAATRLRRSEHAVVRSGALLQLRELYDEVWHPRLKTRIGAALAEHAAAQVAA